MSGEDDKKERTRFSALAEEMTAHVKPVPKERPDLFNQRLRVPRVFEEVIVVKDGKPSPCPRCRCQAFTPSPDGTRVMCRGCPLPAPTYAMDRGGDVPMYTWRYTCSCQTKSSISIDLAEANFYCTFCNQLSIHAREAQPALAKKDANKLTWNPAVDVAVMVDEKSTVTRETVEQIEKALNEYPPAEKLAARWGPSTLPKPTFRLSLREYESLRLSSDTLLARAASTPCYACGHMPDRHRPACERPDCVCLSYVRSDSDYRKTRVIDMYARPGTDFGMAVTIPSGRQLRRVSTIGEVMEAFREKLGLQDYMNYEEYQRNENRRRELRPIDWNRRTGRTTRSLLDAFARCFMNDVKVLFIVAPGIALARQILDTAWSMLGTLNLPCPRQLEAVTPDLLQRALAGRRDADVFNDHTAYERR